MLITAVSQWPVSGSQAMYSNQRLAGLLSNSDTKQGILLTSSMRLGISLSMV